MARRRQFVSTGLHNISKHIAESTSELQKGKAEDKNQQPVELSPAELASSDSVAIAQKKTKAELPEDIIPNISPRNSVAKSSKAIVVEEADHTSVDRHVEVAPGQGVELMAHKKGADVQERRLGERKKAVKKRTNEFTNARRDMINRLTESLATIPDDIESYELRIKLLNQYKNSYEDLVLKIEPLDEHTWTEESYDSELGKGMKIIENARLEHLSSSARLIKLLSGDEVTATSHSGGFDIASLSFKQIFRLGLIFSLPLMAVLIFSSLIIALSYLAIVS